MQPLASAVAPLEKKMPQLKKRLVRELSEGLSLVAQERQKGLFGFAVALLDLPTRLLKEVPVLGLPVLQKLTKGTRPVFRPLTQGL